jgi:hypothetical protein
MPRNRSHAQKNAARRQFVESVSVSWWNSREAQREAAALVHGARSVVAELPILCATIAMLGYVNWWLISGIPVEISRHTSEARRGPTATAIVMRMLGH